MWGLKWVPKNKSESSEVNKMQLITNNEELLDQLNDDLENKYDIFKSWKPLWKNKHNITALRNNSHRLRISVSSDFQIMNWEITKWNIVFEIKDENKEELIWIGTTACDKVSKIIEMNPNSDLPVELQTWIELITLKLSEVLKIPNMTISMLEDERVVASRI